MKVAERLHNPVRGQPLGGQITSRIGQKLAVLRLSEGQTLSDVAKGTGVGESEIWQIEVGGADDLSVALLERMASHFGVTVGFLADPVIDQVSAEIIALHRLCGRLTRSEKAALRKLLQVLTEPRI